MKYVMRFLAAALLMAGLPLVISAATIILVRHAEIGGAMSAETLLSAAGMERAQVLARMLKDSWIRRIYVTELRRTQQTAEPTATALHLTPTVIAQKDTEALLAALRGLGEDETVLLVGHSTTVPVIVKGLGAGEAPAISEAEYDRLTVLTTYAGGKAHAVILRYGAAAH